MTKKVAPVAKKGKSSSFKTFLSDLRQKRIIEILAAFIGGGWLIIEFVDRILVAHYHFPDKTIDITFITLLAALLCILLWRWFSGQEKLRKFKLELVLIPLIVLITVLLDVNLLVHLRAPEAETIPASKWKNSIAVLPFVDMSPQKDQEYFCDGMTEELINRLSNIKELKVPARTSAFFFKGKAGDIREIGRKLDVQTLLEGSIRKIDDQVRVTAQLVNIADGYHLWSDTYNRELRDVFSIQDEIASTIADKLKVTLLGDEKAGLMLHHTEGPAAYEAYLKGRYHLNKRTEEEIKKAGEYFQQAVGIYPNYAKAYSGLADYYNLLSFYGHIRPKDTLPKGKELALKALEIDEKLAEAHTSLAVMLINWDWDLVSSEREYKRAIELNPNYALAHGWYSALLVSQGRIAEAIRELEFAQELDPLSPLSYFLGGYLYFRKEYDKSLEMIRKGLELEPNYAQGNFSLGLVYTQKGMLEEAIKEFQKALQSSGENTQYKAGIGYAYARAGNKVEALRILDELKQLSKGVYVPAIHLAILSTGLDEKDQALAWLERSLEERDSMLYLWMKDPRLDALRSDPRFQDLCDRMSLPD